MYNSTHQHSLYMYFEMLYGACLCSDNYIINQYIFILFVLKL